MDRNSVSSSTNYEPLASQIRQEIITRFKDAPKIARIFENEPGKDYVIFIDHQQYERELMYQLLDIEIDIHEKFGSNYFSVLYLPLFDLEKGGIVSTDAQLIFQQ